MNALGVLAYSLKKEALGRFGQARTQISHILKWQNYSPHQKHFLSAQVCRVLGCENEREKIGNLQNIC